MKSTTLNLQNSYAHLLTWLGISHAKKEKLALFPKKKKKQPQGTVDWTKSAAFTQDRSGMTFLTHEEVMSLLGRD